MISARVASSRKVPIAFPPEMYDWLREVAFRRRVPMAVVVREAIGEYRERADPQLTLMLATSVDTGSVRPPK